jgi:hypothetical protein
VRKQEALFVAMCAGAIAFAFAFVAPMLAGEPIAWYLPFEHRWTFEARPSGFALDFYGRLLQALVAWAAIVLVTLPLARRAKRPLSRRAAGLVTAWTITAVLLVMLHYAWTLHFRRPIPEPLPAGYRAR